MEKRSNQSQQPDFSHEIGRVGNIHMVENIHIFTEEQKPKKAGCTLPAIGMLALAAGATYFTATHWEAVSSFVTQVASALGK